MHSKQFLEYLQLEKRYSPHTISAYQNDLNNFFSFIEEEYGDTPIKEVNYQMVRSWIVNLIENAISTRSVNRKITTLKSFYKYLLKQEIVEENPMRKIISPKQGKKVNNVVSRDSMDLLLDKVEFENNYTGMRNKLIIEMFYLTGMRLAELINLNVQDVDVAEKVLRVTGKRNKQRLIPFPSYFANTIQAYIVERNDVEKANVNTYLFLTEKGKQMYPKLVYNIVKTYLSKVTSIEKKSPHVLRHTFATHMLNEGADLNSIKEILGHANLSATQVYTHNTIDKLKEVYNQAHPRGK